MEVVALTGGCKTGKDYIANLLLKNLPKKNTLIIAFADHFKVDAIIKIIQFMKKYLAKKMKIQERNYN